MQVQTEWNIRTLCWIQHCNVRVPDVMNVQSGLYQTSSFAWRASCVERRNPQNELPYRWWKTNGLFKSEPGTLIFFCKQFIFAVSCWACWSIFMDAVWPQQCPSYDSRSFVECLPELSFPPANPPFFIFTQQKCGFLFLCWLIFLTGNIPAAWGCCCVETLTFVLLRWWIIGKQEERTFRK